MFESIFLNLIAALILTCAGSLWIDKLYSKNGELTFPKKISSRSRFRIPILFFMLAIFICMAENLWIAAAIFLLVLMTITDFEQYMIFDAMTLPLAIIGAIFSLQGNFFNCLAAAVIGGGIFLLIAMVSNGALGGGDVKLIFALGFWLGAQKLFNVMLIGTIAGGIAALILILAKKKTRSSYFAYGPYFALTAIYFLTVRA